MRPFDHEKLEVYQAAMEMIMLVEKTVKEFPKGRAYLSDQLQRAGISVPLNIAEGSGEFSPPEKNRFYRMAKRSATECAAIFEICHRLELIQDGTYNQSRELLLRIVSMLTKLVQINQISH